MSEPSVNDQREALRSAITVVKLSANGDLNGMLQHMGTLNEFEAGCLVGCLAQLAVVGVASIAAVKDIPFSEQLAEFEQFLVDSVNDPAN